MSTEDWSHSDHSSPPPVCIHCNQPRTVKHLLVECQNNLAQRVQFYGSQTITLRDVLGEGRSFNLRKLMLYLNAIGLRDIYEREGVSKRLYCIVFFIL